MLNIGLETSVNVILRAFPMENFSQKVIVIRGVLTSVGMWSKSKSKLLQSPKSEGRSKQHYFVVHSKFLAPFYPTTREGRY